MVVFVAALGRHEAPHGDLRLPHRMWTIWEPGSFRPENCWASVSKTGVATRKHHTTKTITTIYSGRSTRSVCKEIMRKCYAKAGIRSRAMDLTAIRNFYFRSSARETLKLLEKQSETHASLAAIQAGFDQLSAKDAQRAVAKHDIWDRRDKLFRPLISVTNKRLNESTKQPTNTDEPVATPAYRFIVRNSLFPDPKHCNFLSPAWAQLFVQHNKNR